MTLSIIRHMSENENLLGLGSLWDTEQLNAELDEFREKERERKGRAHFSDALTELAREHPLTAWVTVFDRPVHVRRIGMMWFDGVRCGSVDTVVVPFGAIVRVGTSTGCDCVVTAPRFFEFVTFNAVLREVERRSAPVSVINERGGVRGRISGVWRDAVTMRTELGVLVIPHSAITALIVDIDSRL